MQILGWLFWSSQGFEESRGRPIWTCMRLCSSQSPRDTWSKWNDPKTGWKNWLLLWEERARGWMAYVALNFCVLFDAQQLGVVGYLSVLLLRIVAWNWHERKRYIYSQQTKWLIVVRDRCNRRLHIAVWLLVKAFVVLHVQRRVACRALEAFFVPKLKQNIVAAVLFTNIHSCKWICALIYLVQALELFHRIHRFLAFAAQLHIGGHRLCAAADLAFLSFPRTLKRRRRVLLQRLTICFCLSECKLLQILGDWKNSIKSYN